jgi:hypothetical protein
MKKRVTTTRSQNYVIFDFLLQTLTLPIIFHNFYVSMHNNVTEYLVLRLNYYIQIQHPPPQRLRLHAFYSTINRRYTVTTLKSLKWKGSFRGPLFLVLWIFLVVVTEWLLFNNYFPLKPQQVTHIKSYLCCERLFCIGSLNLGSLLFPYKHNVYSNAIFI